MPVNIKLLKEKIKDAYEQINADIKVLRRFANDPVGYLKSLPINEEIARKQSLIERLDTHERWLGEVWKDYCQKNPDGDVDLEKQLDQVLITLASLDKLQSLLNDLSKFSYLALYGLPLLLPINISDAYFSSAVAYSFFGGRGNASEWLELKIFSHKPGPILKVEKQIQYAYEKISENVNILRRLADDPENRLSVFSTKEYGNEEPKALKASLIPMIDDIKYRLDEVFEDYQQISQQVTNSAEQLDRLLAIFTLLDKLQSSLKWLSQNSYLEWYKPTLSPISCEEFSTSAVACSFPDTMSRNDTSAADEGIELCESSRNARSVERKVII